jgi:hypothetical protein
MNHREAGRRIRAALAAALIGFLTWLALAGVNAQTADASPDQTIECLEPDGPIVVNGGGGITCLFIDPDGGLGTVGFMADSNDGTFALSYAGQPIPYNSCQLEVYGGRTQCGVLFEPTGAYPSNGVDYVSVYYGGNTIVSNAIEVLPPTAPTATSTKLKATPNPGKGGFPVVLTATVTATGGGSVTGQVGFTVDGSLVPGCTAIALNSKVPATATCADLLPGGSTYHAVAGYLGTSSLAASASSTLTLKVAKQTTSTSLSAKAKAFKKGVALTLTAKVTGTGAGNPTGKVRFYRSGSPITGCKNVKLSGADKASCKLHVAHGTSIYKARYLGSSSSAGSSHSHSLTL